MKREVKIEKGIPVPDVIRKKGQSMYPFDKLEVGDSFIAVKTGNSWGSFYSMASQAMKKFKIELTSRSIDENSRRVWRVK